MKYTLKDSVNEDGTAVIRLDEGEFEGVEYHYGKVMPIEEGEELRLTFEYEVLNTGKFTDEELKSNEKFEQTVGDLIVQLLEDKIKEEESKDGN
jgi:hypothetical protein